MYLLSLKEKQFGTLDHGLKLVCRIQLTQETLYKIKSKHFLEPHVGDQFIVHRVLNNRKL